MNYKSPERIICLTEETTELLYLLGEEKRIVGITAYTVRPEQAKREKPVVSAFISGSIQKIKNLEPDLIIGFSDIQAQFAHDLIKHGFNVLIFNQRTINEIYNAMYMIGSIIGRTSDIEKLIEKWKTKLAKIKSESENVSAKPKVFFQEWDEPIISSIHWVSELIEIVGGVDCFAGKRKGILARDRYVSKQDVADANPDIIIGSWCGKPVDFDWVYNVEEWKLTPALKNKRVYEIDSSLILQPGPALFLEGIDRLREFILNAKN
ncbi:MAG: cobalamin-binding protein [Leptospiraceae bacterium]|nr:cobalamin-binding protein [Leptospiraceae bacterium]